MLKPDARARADALYRHRTVNKQESINIATYLQLHMAGTSRYTYLPTYARKTNTSLHLLSYCTY